MISKGSLDEKKVIMIDKALGDYITAVTIQEIRPDYAAYHLHQAVEKILKAGLLSFDPELDVSVYQHDVTSLSRTFSKYAGLSEEFRLKCAEVDEIAPSIRYTNSRNDIGQGEIRTMLIAAESIIKESSNVAKVKPFFDEAIHKTVDENLKCLKPILDRESQ